MKPLRQDALDILNAAIQSVLPEAAVKNAMDDWLYTHEAQLKHGQLIVIALGKAAWHMASAAHEIIGEYISDGLVVTKDNHSQGPIPSFEIMEAGHPVPDQRSIKAGDKAMKLVNNLTEKDHVILLISGGGSALFEKPMEGVSLDEIMLITRQLIQRGASRPEAVSMILFKSLIPEREGSVTIKTRSMPDMDAMTGQPMPGDPSIMAMVSSGLAAFFIRFFTSVTNSPELPLPILSWAVENTDFPL